MKVPKISQKAIVIAFSVLGFLLFVGISIVIFPRLTYIGAQIANIVGDAIEDNINTTNTQVSRPEGFYQDSIQFKSSFSDLIIEPSGSLSEVTPPISLFVQSDPANDIYDPDERVKCYEAGTISGEIMESINPGSNRMETKTLAEGTKYYIAIYQEYDPAIDWSGHYEADWYVYSEPIRYFINEGKVYILGPSSFIDKAVDPGIGMVSERIVDSNPEDSIDDSSYEQEKSLLEANVENLVALYGSYDPIAFSTYSAKFSDEYSLTLDYFYFTSTKGAQFQFGYMPVEPSTDLAGYTEIDDYHGLKILVNSRKEFVIIDREGFVQSMVFQVPLDGYAKKEFQLSDGTTFAGTYSSSYGTCEASNDATAFYVFEDVPEGSLQSIATVDGFDIYEKKDPVNDSFTKKVYDEDYIALEYWEWNGLEEDNGQAMTYTEYLSYHPIIYVKDVYRNFIRYTNSDFFPEGGCAKPAIYLYPTETTDISVKVVPNGKLTFTYPAYNEGWNVIASIDGSIVNKSDGKAYDYLWWDSYTYSLNVPENGFVVEKSQIESFLESKLSEMNLNDSEKTEFQSYWVPKMQAEDSEHIFVTFLFNKEVSQIARLEVSPTPENSFRVFMVYKPVSEDYSVSPLLLQHANRIGYSLVEWGGARL